MNRVKFALFPRAEASLDEAKIYDLDWNDFVRGLSEFEFHDEKNETQLLLPVEFTEDATSKQKSAIKSVHLASLDIDGVPEASLTILREFLRNEKYTALLYSTWRNVDSVRGIGKKGEKISPSVRFRILLPLSRPVSSREWPVFWNAYNSHFFGKADTSCKDPSRGYFVPALPRKYENEELAPNEAFIESFDGGRVVDVDWLLHSSSDIPVEREVVASKGERVTRLQIRDFAHTLKKRKNDALRDLGQKMLIGINGGSFEAPGNRDNTVFKICRELGFRFPDGRVEDIASHFGPALLAMEEEEPGAPTFENFKEKLERAQSEARGERVRRQQEAAEKELEEEARKKALLEKHSEITEDTIREHLASVGVEQDVSSFKFLLVFGNDYYVFDGSMYRGPFTPNMLLVVCRELLAEQARGLGFSMEYVIPSDDGPPKVRAKTIQDLLSEYGSFVSDVEYNYEGRSYFDPSSNTLHCCNLRRGAWAAEEVPAVDRWIDAAFGEDADRFRDWLSQVPDLTRSLSALCLIGRPSIGKSAFVEGLSKIWDRAPTPIEIVMGNFNTEILSSPVVIADEDLPRDIRGRVQTEKLRSIISSGSHKVNRKNKPVVNLEGNLRFVVTMNNASNFNFGHAKHSKSDVDAIKRRFLVAELSGSKAVKLFDYTHFVTLGGIARHTLWLSKGRRRRDERFGVDNTKSSFVALADESATMLLDYVYGMLFEMPPTHESDLEYPTIGGGPILVTPKGSVLVSLKIYEDLCLDDKYWKKINKTRFKNLMSAVSSRQVQISLGSTSNKRRFWKLDPNILYRHFRRVSDSGDLEYFQMALALYRNADYLGDMVPTKEQRELREKAIAYFKGLRGISVVTEALSAE